MGNETVVAYKENYVNPERPVPAMSFYGFTMETEQKQHMISSADILQIHMPNTIR